MDPAVKQEIEKMKVRLKTVEDGNAAILKAFPGSDLEGHRVYHELLIDEARDRKKLIALIKEKTIIALIWMFLVFIAGLLIHGLHDAAYNWLFTAKDKPPT